MNKSFNWTRLYYSVATFCFICLITWLVLDSSEWGKNHKDNRIADDVKAAEFADVLEAAGMDRSDHNALKLFFLNSTPFDLTWVTNQDEIIEKCEPGDSLIKRNGSLELKIRSNDSVHFVKIIPFRHRH